MFASLQAGGFAHVSRSGADTAMGRTEIIGQCLVMIRFPQQASTAGGRNEPRASSLSSLLGSQGRVMEGKFVDTDFRHESPP
jgi:hypothetical protein